MSKKNDLQLGDFLKSGIVGKFFKIKNEDEDVLIVFKPDSIQIIASDNKSIIIDYTAKVSN